MSDDTEYVKGWEAGHIAGLRGANQQERFLANQHADDLGRMLEQAWIYVHYGMDHKSVMAGDLWMRRCTDDPCPTIRALLHR